MAGNRRGFTNERHARAKVAVSLVAVTGFAAAWAAFASSHEDLPAVPAGEPTSAATTTATATAGAGATPATATAPTRARRSRGS